MFFGLKGRRVEKQRPTTQQARYTMSQNAAIEGGKKRKKEKTRGTNRCKRRMDIWFFFDWGGRIWCEETKSVE